MGAYSLSNFAYLNFKLPSCLVFPLFSSCISCGHSRWGHFKMTARFQQEQPSFLPSVTAAHFQWRKRTRIFRLVALPWWVSRATPNTPGSLEWLEARLIYERRHESSWHFPLGRRQPADRETPGAIWHLDIEWNRVSVSSSRPFFKKGLICSPGFPVMVRTDPDRCLIYHRLFR